MLQLQIEPADLFRVFPAFALSDATPQTGSMERDATTDCSWPNCVRSSPICGAGRTIRGRSVTTGEPRASVSRPHTPTAAQMLETTSISLASRIRPNCDGGHRLSFNPSLDMTPSRTHLRNGSCDGSGHERSKNHSIMSSARVSSVAGSSRPSASAVLRLMNSSISPHVHHASRRGRGLAACGAGAAAWLASSSPARPRCDCGPHRDAGQMRWLILDLGELPCLIDISKLNPGPSGEDADAVGQPRDVGSPCASAR